MLDRPAPSFPSARTYILGPVIVCLAVAACGGQSYAKQLEGASSLSATAEFAGEAFSAGDTPARYTERTLEVVTQALSQLAHTLQQIPGDSVATAIELIQDVAHQSDSLGTIAQTGDRSLVRVKLAPLHAASEHLSSLADQAKAAEQAKTASNR
jgi:hypothetical protein